MKFNGFKYLREFPKSAWFLVGIALVLGLFLGKGPDVSAPESAMSSAYSEADQWWTCSMHPQIKLREPGQCPICFMDLIPLESESVDGDLDYNEIKMSNRAMALAEIRTVEVHRGVPIMTIQLSGKIEPDERRVKTITAWVPGRLERLFADFTGTRVR